VRLTISSCQSVHVSGPTFVSVSEIVRLEPLAIPEAVALTRSLSHGPALGSRATSSTIVT
jgi:hypothetical protein